MSNSLDFSRSKAGAPRSRRISYGVFVVIRLGLAAVFLASGMAKLIGTPTMTDMVGQIQPGDGFRWAIGAAQVLGGGLLLLRGSSAFGAALLFVVMLGVALLQYVVDSSAALPILGLVYLCLAIIFERAS